MVTPHEMMTSSSKVILVAATRWLAPIKQRSPIMIRAEGRSSENRQARTELVPTLTPWERNPRKARGATLVPAPTWHFRMRSNIGDDRNTGYLSLKGYRTMRLARSTALPSQPPFCRQIAFWTGRQTSFVKAPARASMGRVVVPCAAK